MIAQHQIRFNPPTSFGFHTSTALLIIIIRSAVLESLISIRSTLFKSILAIWRPPEKNPHLNTKTDSILQHSSNINTSNLTFNYVIRQYLHYPIHILSGIQIRPEITSYRPPQGFLPQAKTATFMSIVSTPTLSTTFKPVKNDCVETSATILNTASLCIARPEKYQPK